MINFKKYLEDNNQELNNKLKDNLLRSKTVDIVDKYIEFREFEIESNYIREILNYGAETSIDFNNFEYFSNIKNHTHNIIVPAEYLTNSIFVKYVADYIDNSFKMIFDGTNSILLFDTRDNLLDNINEIETIIYAIKNK